MAHEATSGNMEKIVEDFMFELRQDRMLIDMLAELNHLLSPSESQSDSEDHVISAMQDGQEAA